MSHHPLKKRAKVWVECLGWYLATPLRLLVDACLRHANLFVVYRTWGATLGDAFMVTAIVDILRRQLGARSIVFTKKPVFFVNNPDVAWLWDYNAMPKLVRSLAKSACKFLRGGRVICSGLEVWTIRRKPWGDDWDLADHRMPYFLSFVHEHPDLADWSRPRPRLYFSPEEEARLAEKFAALPRDYVLVKVSAGADTRPLKLLKNWSVEKMNQVIAQVPDHAWVQVGDAGEPVLEGVVDLTGKTDLRELFYLVSRARLVVTIEGLLSHLAAAFEVPSVVVFSWMRTPSDHEYPRMTKVFVADPPPCAPCFATDCKTPGKPCTGAIEADQVLEAVRKSLG